MCGGKQKTRKTVYVHYDPLKGGGSERWYGRFVRNKDYKLYNDGRFYRLSKDPREQTPIPVKKLKREEEEIKKSFQTQLNAAPLHYFKQPAEYKK